MSLSSPSAAAAVTSALMTTNNNDNDTPSTPHHQQGHPLQCSWTLWYDGKKGNSNSTVSPTPTPTATINNNINSNAPSTASSWAAQLVEVQTVATVEDFWSLFIFLKKPAAMEVRTNYYFFKTGHRPMWEDHVNGGRWVVPVQGGDLQRVDNIWEMTLLAAIGERLEGGCLSSLLENNKKMKAANGKEMMPMGQIHDGTPPHESGVGNANDVVSAKDIVIGVALTKKPESFKVEFWLNSITNMDRCRGIGESILHELGWSHTTSGKAPRIALLPLKVSNSTEVLCQM